MNTCSTSSVGNNLEMVGKVHYCTENEVPAVHTNGVLKTFTKIKLLKLLPLGILINKDSMASILSLNDVSSIPGVHIIVDSSKEIYIIVDNGKIVKFKECCYGINYHAVGSYHYAESKNTVNNYTMVQTDKGKKS